jgi:hypothetical protein
VAKFEKGKSGNPKGGKTREQKASLLKAFIDLAASQPWLIKEAFERGLKGSRPLGYLELGARLMKEIGSEQSTAPKIAIVFNSNLDTNKLKEGAAPPRLMQMTMPALPAHAMDTEHSDLLEEVEDSVV